MGSPLRVALVALTVLLTLVGASGVSGPMGPALGDRLPISVGPPGSPSLGDVPTPHGLSAMNSSECRESAATEVECSALTAGVSPTSALGFQLASATLGAPPSLSRASLVWDPSVGGTVLFGGWNGHSATNETWIFQNGTWTNVTGVGVAPPARYGASMAYDGEAGVDAVVLFGGCDPLGECPRNDTWLYSHGAWQNVTASIGPVNGRWDASMTMWGTNGTILFGGCVSSGCTAQSNATWAFQATPSCETRYGGSCWVNLTSGTIRGASPPARASAALGDDPLVGPVDGELVLYGGSSTACSGCGSRDVNDTWLFAADQWTQVQPPGTAGAYPNAGRSGAEFAWDASTQALWLFGGVNDTTGASYDQLWTTDVLVWSNESSLSLPSPVRTDPAIASDIVTSGGAERPILVGGANRSGSLENDTWVFEPLLVTQVHAEPNPVEANATAYLFSNTSGGASARATWSFGDGGTATGGNVSHVYAEAGTYSVTVTVTDSFGVRNRSAPLAVAVRLFSLTLSVPSATDESANTSFSVGPANGTPPYRATWRFSDGLELDGVEVHRTFSSIGPVALALSVVDATGTLVNASVTVRVGPSLVVSADAEPATLDLGSITQLSVAASGGTPPYVPRWAFPDGRTAVGTSLSYRPTTAGPVNVTLNLTDSAGVSENLVVPLVVDPALGLTVSASKGTSTSGRTVTFSAALSGGTPPFQYAWAFGDGSTSSVPAPSHTYATSGTFTLRLWVNDSAGGTSHQVVEVQVPRTSGGLIWQIGGLPELDRALLAAGAAAVVLALVAAGVHLRKRGRAAERRRPEQLPGALETGPSSPARLNEVARGLSARLAAMAQDDPAAVEGRRHWDDGSAYLTARRYSLAAESFARVDELLGPTSVPGPSPLDPTAPID